MKKAVIKDVSFMCGASEHSIGLRRLLQNISNQMEGTCIYICLLRLRAKSLPKMLQARQALLMQEVICILGRCHMREHGLVLYRSFLRTFCTHIVNCFVHVILLPIDTCFSSELLESCVTYDARFF